MDYDFEQYEREYLERRVNGVKPDPGTLAEEVAKLHRERMESAKKAVAEAALY